MDIFNAFDYKTHFNQQTYDDDDDDDFIIALSFSCGARPSAACIHVSMVDFDTFEFQSNVFVTISRAACTFVCFHFGRSHFIFFSFRTGFCFQHPPFCSWWSMHWPWVKIGTYWIANDFLLIIRFCLTFYLFIFCFVPEYESGLCLRHFHSFVFVCVVFCFGLYVWPQSFALPFPLDLIFSSLFIFFFLAWLCAQLNRTLLFSHIFQLLALSKRKNIDEKSKYTHALAHSYARMGSANKKKTKLADWKKQKVEAREKIANKIIWGIKPQSHWTK